MRKIFNIVILIILLTASTSFAGFIKSSFDDLTPQLLSGNEDSFVNYRFSYGVCGSDVDIQKTGNAGDVTFSNFTETGTFCPMINGGDWESDFDVEAIIIYNGIIPEVFLWDSESKTSSSWLTTFPTTSITFLKCPYCDEVPIPGAGILLFSGAFGLVLIRKKRK
jgi:hypothetical protein